MLDTCYNRLTAIGTSAQIKNIQMILHEVFGKNCVVNSNTGNEKGVCLVCTVTSIKTMPQQDLKRLTIRLHDTKNLYIKVESQNISVPYFDNAIFSYGLWSFEPMPAINAKVNELKEQGIGYIKKHIEEHGNITNIADDELIFATYLDEQDYGVASPYSSIDLYLSEEIIVTLRDDHTIYEADLSIQNVLDIIAIIQNHYGTRK